MDYRVLGISSGIGVSLFPARKKVIGNIEPRAIFHTANSEQWEINFGEVPLWRTFPPPEEDAVFLQNPLVIVSSPDCGSGSILRYSRSKQLGNIKKNLSLRYFFKGIKKFQPEFFYFENLPAMFKSLPEEEFRKKVKNYNLVIHEASVCMWGNSQLYRKRMVIIGIRRDLNCSYTKMFRLPDYRDRMKTCGELYGDLDFDNHGTNISMGHIRENVSDSVTMYSKYKCTIDFAHNHWNTVLKDKKRWEVEGRKFKNAPGVYRNRKKDYPATARKANRQFDHHGLMLTPRQLARIQGIPDDFIIYMKDDGRRNYWINKGRAAVTKTPPMEISTWFFKQLNKYYGTI